MSSHSAQVPPGPAVQTNGSRHESSPPPRGTTSPSEAAGKHAKKRSKSNGDEKSDASSASASNGSKSAPPQTASGPLPKTYSLGSPTGTVERFNFNQLTGSFLSGAFVAPSFKSRNRKNDIPIPEQNNGMSPVQVADRARSGLPMVATWRFGAKATPKKTQQFIDRNNRKSIEHLQAELQTVVEAQIPLPDLPPAQPVVPKPAPPPPTASADPNDPNVISRRLAVLHTGDASAASLVPTIPYVPEGKKRRRKDVKFTVVNPGSSSSVTTPLPETESEDSRDSSVHQQQPQRQQDLPVPSAIPRESDQAMTSSDAAEVMLDFSERAPTTPQHKSGPETLRVYNPLEQLALQFGTPLRDERVADSNIILEEILGQDLDADLPAGLTEGFAPAMGRPSTPRPATPARSAIIGLPTPPRSPRVAHATEPSAGDDLFQLTQINDFLQTIKPTDLYAEVPKSAQPAPQPPAATAASSVVSDIVKLVADEEKDKSSAPSPKKHKHHRHSCHKHHRSGGKPVTDL